MFYETHRDRGIYWSKRDNGCVAHLHQSVEFLYVIEGEKRVTVDGRKIELSPGDLAVCLPYEPHAYALSCGEQLCVTLPPEYCREFSERVAGREIVGGKIPASPATADIYEHLLRLEPRKNPVLTRGIAEYALGAVLEAAEFGERTNRGGEFLRGVLAFVEEHYAEDLTLGGVAARFGYSRCYFSRLFNNALACHFNDYLNQVRIYSSLRLLRSRPVSSVYAECGFHSPQQYYLHFRRVLGSSPSRYLSEN